MSGAKKVSQPSVEGTSEEDEEALDKTFQASDKRLRSLLFGPSVWGDLVKSYLWQQTPDLSPN